MDPARWQQIERLYHTALARPPRERAAYLVQACAGDEALRHDVQSLLESPATADGFLAAPALAVAARMVSVPVVSALTGWRLGVYQLQDQIGAGGMGEVYRARDTRLGREVAIKILPRAFAADPDRLARFEREARVLAALNHPHIAAIHGVEEGPARDGSHLRGLVLELVEGETLADRLARSRLASPDALDIAWQIAEALEAAHDKGIIHRDLKPANIKVTPDGHVKVLDFGLAKAVNAGMDSAGPTITVDATGDGLIVGTAAYMSPEQARGQPVDKRTDIWAFGCVLYEMLAGRPAFPGTTVSDTIAAILERTPDWNAVPAGTPDTVRRLLGRALEKDHRRRLRDIGDARLDIESARSDGDATRPSVAVSARARRTAQWLGVAGLGVLAVLAIGGTVWGLASRPPAVPTIGSLTRLTSDSGLTTEPSISADGRLIAYASDRSGDGNLDIWVQQATGGAAIRLTTDPANDREPDVSPDGSLIAFRSDRNPRGIYVMPAFGGDARLIARDGMVPRFSPDGRSIAFWTGNWLSPRGVEQVRQTFVIPTSGGEAVQVAANLANAGDPVWSPDGRSLLIFGRLTTSGEGTDPDWWSVSPDGGSPIRSGVYARLRAHQLVLDVPDTQPYPFGWTRDGVLFAALAADADSPSIWEIAVDAGTGRVAGNPIRLTTGTTADTWPAVSRDGRMVFAATTKQMSLFALPLDVNAGRARAGLQRVRDDSAETGRAGASEDGSLVVFPRYEFGAGGVWLRDLRTGRERQIAVTPRTPLNPVISADGRWVAYTVTTVDTGGGAGPGAGYVVEVAGGAPRQVCDDCQVFHWARDNRQVVIWEDGKGMTSRLDLATGARIPVVTALADRPLIAPNQRWIVFTNPRPRQVVAAPLHPDRATPTEEWLTIRALSGAERSAGLSPDGRLLYVLLESDGFRCLYGLRLDGSGRPVGEPFPVHHFHDPSRQWGSTGFGNAAVTGMFLANLDAISSNIWMTTLASQ